MSSSQQLPVALPIFAILPQEELDARIDAEFAALRKLDEIKAPCTVAERMTDFNRYCDVLANDETLMPPMVDAATLPHVYINGNRIGRHLFASPHEFIACQAPLPGPQMRSFWSTVYASQCSLIVMLTQEVERGMRKADRYWPTADQRCLRHGDMEVTLEAAGPAANHADVIVVDVVVCQVDSAGGGAGSETSTNAATPHRVRIVQYLGWPDFGVPANANAFLAVLRYVELTDPAHPIIVHCSAGIGRTGTLLGVYLAWHLWSNTHSLEDDSIFQIVRTLKLTRRGMVQRREQYAFIYRCVRFMIKRAGGATSEGDTADGSSSSGAASESSIRGSAAATGGGSRRSSNGRR